MLRCGSMEFEFERKAMAGKPCPKDMDVADACAYVALKNLYAMYKNGLISRSEAVQEKKNVVRSWTTAKSKLEFLDRENESLKYRIYDASKRYAENQTIENADNLYAAFYNLPSDWKTHRQKEDL